MRPCGARSAQRIDHIAESGEGREVTLPFVMTFAVVFAAVVATVVVPATVAVTKEHPLEANQAGRSVPNGRRQVVSPPEI